MSSETAYLVQVAQGNKTDENGTFYLRVEGPPEARDVVKVEAAVTDILAKYFN